MAKDPAQRPPSMVDCARRLQAAQTMLGEAVTPLRATDIAPLPPQAHLSETTVVCDSPSAEDRSKPPTTPTVQPATTVTNAFQAKPEVGGQAPLETPGLPGPTGRVGADSSPCQLSSPFSSSSSARFWRSTRSSVMTPTRATPARAPTSPRPHHRPRRPGPSILRSRTASTGRPARQQPQHQPLQARSGLRSRPPSLSAPNR